MGESTEVRGLSVRKAIQSVPDGLPQLTGQNPIPLTHMMGSAREAKSGGEIFV